MHLRDLPKRSISELSSVEATELVIYERTIRYASTSALTIQADKAAKKELSRIEKQLEKLLDKLPPNLRKRYEADKLAEELEE